MPQQPEKPQQPQLPNDTRTQAIGSEELPYVNEVEAALARKPRLGARFLSLAVGLFFLILGIWANFAEIDEVTHANGQVISSQRTQIIQNLEGGILGAVLVGEGEIVEKGTPLAQLDNKLAESQYRDAQNRILENELSIIRLDAELNRPPSRKNCRFRTRRPSLTRWPSSMPANSSRTPKWACCNRSMSSARAKSKN